MERWYSQDMRLCITRELDLYFLHENGGVIKVMFKSLRQAKAFARRQMGLGIVWVKEETK